MKKKQIPIAVKFKQQCLFYFYFQTKYKTIKIGYKI